MKAESFIPSILFIGKFDENLRLLEEFVLNYFRNKEKNKSWIKFQYNPSEFPDVVKYKENRYDLNIWCIKGDVKPTLLLKDLISKATFILFVFNFSNKETLDFLNDGWGPIFQRVKLPIDNIQDPIIIGAKGEYINNNEIKIKIDDTMKKFNINFFYEFNTLQKNSIIPMVQHIENRLKNILLLRQNASINKNIQANDDDSDDGNEKKEIEVEKTVLLKSKNNINYKLFLTSHIACVVESQEAKGDVFIPTFVDFQSKQFKVTRICDEAFKKSSIESVSFSDDSQVQTIGNFAFENSTIHKLFIPANLIKLSEKWACNANELIEIEVDINNRYFLNKNGFLIFSRHQIDTNANENNTNKVGSESNNEYKNENKNENDNENKNENDNESKSDNGNEDITEDDKNNENKSIGYETPIQESDIESCEILFAPRNFEGEFLIPEKVTSISPYAFSQRLGIVSVKSESPKLQKIRLFCFFGCENLKKVSFKGQNDLLLGGFCFSNSKNLTKVEISCKKIMIGKSCFKDCSSLSSIDLIDPGEVKIGDSAFQKCTSLDNILIFNASSIKIGSECFANAINLKSAVFVANSVILGNDFIKNCQKLSAITIKSEENLAISADTFGSNNLKCVKLVTKSTLELDDLFFKHSKKIKNIELSFKQIYNKKFCFSEYSLLTMITLQCEDDIHIINDFFTGCKSLKKLFLSSKFSIFISDQFMNGSENLESIEISGAYVYIGSYSFNNCQSLSRLSITNTAQVDIKEGQFINCNKLNAILIQSSIVNISQKQICNYKSLRQIKIESNSQIFLRQNCFNGFTGLKKVSISGENILIEENCFKNCSNLNKIDIIKAENLTFESKVFNNCSNLIEIEFKVDSNLICGHDTFYGSSVKKAKFEGKVVELGKSCFEDHFFVRSAISEIFIKSEKVIIGDSCFNGCYYLNVFSISTSKNVEIKNNAFEKCNNLVSISLSVEEKLRIMSNCFSNAQKLKEFSVLSSKNLEFGICAFEDCINLEKVKLNAENQIILLENCFSKAKNLKTFDFNCNEIVFGEYCFYGCFSLINFINKSADKLTFSKQAFSYCNNLENVIITTKSEFKAGNYCFDRLLKLKKVVIKSSNVTIGDFCFSGCISLNILAFPTATQFKYYKSYRFECYNVRISINPNAIKTEINSDNIEIHKAFVNHINDYF